jgi:hypothetical protein
VEADGVTCRTQSYDLLHDVVKEIDWAGCPRNSDLQGSTLGRQVARYDTDHQFQSAT